MIQVKVGAAAALLMMISSYVVLGQSPERKPRPRVPDINGRATLIVKPEYTSAAALDADSSTLPLKVVVDVNGNVISAQCSLDTPSSLKAATEAAAMASKFAPLILNGQAVEYEGILLYSIAIARVNWFRFGTALASAHNFDNISVAPVAAGLTNEYAEERARLNDIDNEKNVNERIKKIGAEIGHFKKKLKGKEQWIFSTAVAVRNATFWTMAGERINRTELQTALAKISTAVDSAPAEIPKEFVDALKEIAAYKIDPEIDERKLRQDIFKLQAKLDSPPR